MFTCRRTGDLTLIDPPIKLGGEIQGFAKKCKAWEQKVDEALGGQRLRQMAPSFLLATSPGDHPGQTQQAEGGRPQ
jgi:hypothetical protein